MAACGGSSPFYGLTLSVTGDYDNWQDNAQTPTLAWDDDRRIYSGVVELPGDELHLQLFAPRVGMLVGLGLTGSDAGGTFPMNLPAAVGTDVAPWHVSTPLAAKYQLDFDPAQGSLHIDLASDAETGQSPEIALLIAALRGADTLSASDLMQRGQSFINAINGGGIETPLRSDSGTYQSITILHLGTVDAASLSLVGDFNNFTAGIDLLHFTLSKQVAYAARRTPGLRWQYLFDRDGTRYADPLNLEIAWDGVPLPPNPANLLGGNVGQFYSIAYTPGYVEQGPRLRRLPLPSGPLGVGEVIVYLPPGYDQNPGVSYPSIYLHDGKDSIVRGQYDHSLYVLAEQAQIPPLIGVFVSAPSDPTDRLSAFASFPDSHYPDVTPQGDAYASYLLQTVLPAVEKTYRTKLPRAMLGIDMAGPFTFHLAWSDSQNRFTRLVSQSGRFGWGDPNPQYSPYINEILSGQSHMSTVLQRVAVDWSMQDFSQVQDSGSLSMAFSMNDWTGKALLSKQTDQYTDPWASLRARAEASLTFLLQDLVGH